MRNSIICGLLLISLVKCQGKQSGNKQNIIHQKQQTMQEQPIYTLKILAANRYETYVNDMPLEKDYLKGSTDTEIPINDFILASGIQKIKIVLLPDSGKVVVDKSGISYLNVTIYKYPRGLSYMTTDEAVVIKEINLKDKTEAPIVVKEVEISVEVPYKINGWSNSVDLAKENQELLKKEVIAKYEELRQIINKGDFEAFENAYSQRDKEINEAIYNNVDAIKEDKEWMSKRVMKCKNKMNVISNVTMHLNGGNKIVYLENVDHESPIIGDIDGKHEEVFNIMLHRPKPGAPLEIIR
jgi:hypothetical protein